MQDKKELPVSPHPFDETMLRVLRVKPEPRAKKVSPAKKPEKKKP